MKSFIFEDVETGTEYIAIANSEDEAIVLFKQVSNNNFYLERDVYGDIVLKFDSIDSIEIGVNAPEIGQFFYWGAFDVKDNEVLDDMTNRGIFCRCHILLLEEMPQPFIQALDEYGGRFNGY